MNLLRSLAAEAMDMVYPRQCPGCRARLERGAPLGEWCRACTENIVPVDPPYCRICSEPFPGEIDDPLFTCPNCSGQEQAYEFAVAAALSRGPVRETIHQFKYGRRPALRLPLVNLMLCALNDERIASVSDWLLVPVPLYGARFRERGFNQAEELAELLARRTGWPLCRALRRVRDTGHQASLDRRQRLQNLRGAFVVRRWQRRTRGRNVLLIDDVFTTGSTAHECARILRADGAAAKVAVLTAARG